MPMDIDLYIPIFTILQFYFYMGLLKVNYVKPLVLKTHGLFYQLIFFSRVSGEKVVST